MADRAQFELVNIHRSLKTTVSGNAPAKFEPSETQLKVRLTPAQIAAQKLGPDASADQQMLYAKAIISINSSDVPAGADVNDQILAGTKLKLPWQTADGGITWKSTTASNTIWKDKSAIVENNDGTGMAHYDYEGKKVQVKWDP